MKKIFSINSGFTILELMVTIFIFSIAIFSLFHGLRTGDRIGSRGNVSRTTALLASNEAERIRNSALQGIQVQDSAYIETVSGMRYYVFRTNVNALEIKTYTEMEIRVEPQSALYQPYIFKLIQGYHR